jgi:hypothetical protein
VSVSTGSGVSYDPYDVDLIAQPHVDGAWLGVDAGSGVMTDRVEGKIAFRLKASSCPSTRAAYSNRHLIDGDEHA